MRKLIALLMLLASPASAALLAYNQTGAPVQLAGTTVTLPPATSPPSEGAARDVTAALRVLNAGQFAALEAQRPGVVRYQWTALPEFSTSTLLVARFVADQQRIAHGSLAYATQVASDRVDLWKFQPSEAGKPAWSMQCQASDNPQPGPENQICKWGWNVDGSVAARPQAFQVQEQMYDAGLGPVHEYYWHTAGANGARAGRPVGHDVNETYGYVTLVEAGDVYITKRPDPDGGAILSTMNASEGMYSATTGPCTGAACNGSFPYINLVLAEHVPGFRVNGVDFGDTATVGGSIELRVSQESVPFRSKARRTILGRENFDGSTADLSAVLMMMPGTNAATCIANHGCIRVNAATGKLQFSWSTGAYVDLH